MMVTLERFDAPAHGIFKQFNTQQQKYEIDKFK